MRNPFKLTGNPNRSNRGSANGPPSWKHIDGDDDWATAPPRVDQAVALTCGFYDLITFQNTADPSTTLLF